MKRESYTKGPQVDNKRSNKNNNDTIDRDEFIVDETGHECFSPMISIRKVPLFDPITSYSSKDKWHEYIKNRLQELQYPYVLLNKSDPAVAFALLISNLLFTVKPDAEHAIDAFVKAHEASLYPPLWVLNFLYDIFREWQRQDCKTSIDVLLGLKGEKRRGKRVSYTEAINLTKRNHELSEAVHCLILLFDFKIYEASKAVSERRYETHKEYVNPETLKTIYSKQYSKYYEEVHSLRESLKEWTDEQKAKFLQAFPKASLPQRNKKRFEKYLNLIPAIEQ